jgi:hypothetical protein
MKELSAEQLLENWKEFLGYINTYIPGERGEKLKTFYKVREERFIYMPASSVEHYHSAFPGGYIEHVNRVIRATLDIKEMWVKYGSPINCTDEELVFTAMNHDLGKYGNDEHPFYVPNSSEWHRKNQGKIYEYSEGLGKMQVPDRSLFLLSTNGITYSETEYIGIKTHDGMYDDANKYYLAGYGGWTQKLKSSCSYIVHQADMMAARVEFEEWRDNYREGAPTKVSKPKQEKKVSTANNPINTNQAKAFDDLFKNLNA